MIHGMIALVIFLFLKFHMEVQQVRTTRNAALSIMLNCALMQINIYDVYRSVYRINVKHFMQFKITIRLVFKQYIRKD